MDSMQSHSGDSGVIPKPPSIGMEVMYEWTRRMRSAGDRGPIAASSECGVTGRPDRKSEWLGGWIRLGVRTNRSTNAHRSFLTSVSSTSLGQDMNTSRWPKDSPRLPTACR
jgi:hypothetical protein